MQGKQSSTELKLISVKMAAAMSNVTPRTFAKWESLGLTPSAVQIGKKGAKRFLKSDIENWILARCPDRKTWEQMKEDSDVR